MAVPHNHLCSKQPSDTLQSATIAAVNQGKQTPPEHESTLLAVTNKAAICPYSLFHQAEHIPDPQEPRK